MHSSAHVTGSQKMPSQAAESVVGSARFRTLRGPQRFGTLTFLPRKLLCSETRNVGFGRERKVHEANPSPSLKLGHESFPPPTAFALKPPARPPAAAHSSPSAPP